MYIIRESSTKALWIQTRIFLKLLNPNVVIYWDLVVIPESTIKVSSIKF